MNAAASDLPPRLALTPGEPAGVGPDIALQLARHDLNAEIVVFADPELLQQRARLLRLEIKLDVRSKHSGAHNESGVLKVVPIPLKQSVSAGILRSGNASYVLNSLELACRACLEREYDALVTGPVHKGIINEAGIPFSGHTEFLARQCEAPQAVMMLAAKKLRVALATTHLPLAAVSAALTADKLETVIRILHRDLRERFGLDSPRILVCGLNPHAGEDGHLGREEIISIIPVIEKLSSEGFRLTGPVPADTAFTHEALAQTDVVLSMYHDQGLPVLKHLGFGEAVNITLGLPIIRTSVDHGTALTIAGTSRARAGSLYCAIHIAAEMARIVNC
ncbi:MAG: 4-hydroxythreonine-4-phosphate dehydrogenase PdxA [Gammaproteobacteria bacterium]|nr:4-hydroxythreonine-4-phosphate dehydrogenase PdxA [Gammaproteobacteria bacterium]